MKRMTLVACGWAITVIAAFASIYQVCDFILSPPQYRGVAYISFNSDVPGCTDAYDELYAKPSFIYSPKILVPVIQMLDLPVIWGNKYAGNDNVLNLKDTYNILLGRIVIFLPKSHSGSAELNAYADNPKEAMDIVNSIAYQYRDYFQQKGYSPPVSIVSESNGKIIHWWARIFPFPTLHFFLSALFTGPGIILIQWGRKYPPPIPVRQIPGTNPISTY